MEGAQKGLPRIAVGQPTHPLAWKRLSTALAHEQLAGCRPATVLDPAAAHRKNLSHWKVPVVEVTVAFSIRMTSVTFVVYSCARGGRMQRDRC